MLKKLIKQLIGLSVTEIIDEYRSRRDPDIAHPSYIIKRREQEDADRERGRIEYEKWVTTREQLGQSGE